MLLTNGILYSAFYAVSATLSSLFAEIYPFLSEAEIGLCFLGVGLGGVAGTVCSGKLLDYQFKAVKRKYDRSHANTSDPEKHDGSTVRVFEQDEDFPIEQARLQAQHIWIFTFAIATIGYGWAIQRRVNLAVPIILQFISRCLSHRRECSA